MTKLSNITLELVTTTKCARLLTEAGDKITRQGLSKYVKKNGLIAEMRGNRIMLDFEIVKERRIDFTREVMRGEHSTKIQNPVLIPAKKPTLTEVSSLDQARDAKARKENAQAEKAELDLANAKNALVDIADVEAGSALANMALREVLLGSLLSDGADRLLTVLGLPDAKKRPAQQVLRELMTKGLTKFGETCVTVLEEFDQSRADTAATRLDELIAHAATLRESSTDLQAHA